MMHSIHADIKLVETKEILQLPSHVDRKVSPLPIPILKRYHGLWRSPILTTLLLSYSTVTFFSTCIGIHKILHASHRVSYLQMKLKFLNANTDFLL
jgi:hypothetical protein